MVKDKSEIKKFSLRQENGNITTFDINDKSLSDELNMILNDNGYEGVQQKDAQKVMLKLMTIAKNPDDQRAMIED